MYLRKKRQQGNMIVMAIFIIVVMSMLALNLMRLRLSNQDTLVRENLGAQAWFLSHSASEWALTQMYPLNQPALAANLTTACTNLNNNTATATARTALAANLPCSTPVVTCTNPNPNLPSELVYFQITTTAVCGSDSFQVQRGQQVWTRPVD